MTRKGRTWRVAVERGGVSGPRHSLRWKADELDADGKVINVMYGGHAAVANDNAFDAAVNGLFTAALARIDR